MVLCDKEGGRRLRFVMLRENGPMQNGIVPYFTVVQPDGTPCFRIIGEKNPFTGKLALQDGAGAECARVLRVGTPSLSYHTIWQAERKRAVLTRNLGAPKTPYRLYSIGWKFRGDCFSGNFDVVDRRGRTVMTHGLCWYGGEERVCVETFRGEEALCLCIAAVVDSTPRTLVGSPCMGVSR